MKNLKEIQKNEIPIFKKSTIIKFSLCFYEETHSIEKKNKKVTQNLRFVKFIFMQRK